MTGWARGGRGSLGTGPQGRHDVLRHSAQARGIVGIDSDSLERLQVALAKSLHKLDFLEKPCNDNQLIETVHRAISKDVKDRLERANRTLIRNSLDSLTDRENCVLDLLVTGQSNKKIAETLTLSPKTIERHRSSIMRKLSVRSFANLVQIVERNRG